MDEQTARVVKEKSIIHGHIIIFIIAPLTAIVLRVMFVLGSAWLSSALQPSDASHEHALFSQSGVPSTDSDARYCD